MVLKHQVSHLRENEALSKLLTFRPICNDNMTEKSSTHIAELFYTQYFKFKSKISCNFAKSIVLKNSKKSAEMAAKMANML